MAWTASIGGNDVIVEQDNHGHWVLVLNYEHYGGENPTVSPGSTFPQMPNGYTSTDDVQQLGTSGELRHVDNIQQYSSEFEQVDAVRLEGETVSHSRTLKYFTQNQTVIDSVVYDSTSADHADLESNITKYPNHNTYLPDNTSGNNQTDADSNHIFGHEFPMYGDGDGDDDNEHWALAGSGNRWEMDDFPSDASNTTVHRVWVRLPQGVPSPSAVKRTTNDEILKT